MDEDDNDKFRLEMVKNTGEFDTVVIAVFVQCMNSFQNCNGKSELHVLIINYT